MITSVRNRRLDVVDDLTRRKFIGSGISLAALVAACGNESSPPSSTGTVGTGSRFPVTIEHKLGSTVIPVEPKRVVAIGVAERDITLALGVKPVAVGGYGDVDPWFNDVLGGPALENLEITEGLPIERIASFDPDLIITGWGEDADYAKLSQISPVLWTVSETFSTDWRDQTRTIAKVLGRDEQADKLIAELDSDIKKVRDAHPQFAGKTFTWTAYDPGIASLVDLPTAPVIRFMEDLGFVMKPGIGDPNSVYSRDVSTELLSELDADVMIVYPSSAEARTEFESLPTFDTLNAGRNGAIVYLNDQVANGFNSPTPLSIPYVFKNLVPDLEKAVG